MRHRNNLRKLREERGWSILQLSAKSGVPVEIVKYLEQVDSIAGVEPQWIIKVARPFRLLASEVFMPEN